MRVVTCCNSDMIYKKQQGDTITFVSTKTKTVKVKETELVKDGDMHVTGKPRCIRKCLN